MKHLCYILVLLTLCPASGIWAQPRSVTIGIGPQPLDVVEEAMTDYAVAARTTVNGKAFQYRGPDHTNGPWKVDYAGRYVRFLPMDANANAVTHGKGLVNKPVQWAETDVRQEICEGLVRVMITAKSIAAPSSFTWRVDADTTMTRQADGSIVIDNGITILPPWAVDANGDSLAVTVTLTGPVNGYYTLTKSVTYDGAVFPVTIDPSVVAGPISAASAASMDCGKAVYLTARDTTASTGVSAAMYVGQLAGGTIYISRSAIRFPVHALPTADTTHIDSVVVTLDNGVDQSTVDFIWAPIAFNGDSTTTNNYTQFTGWKASGAYTDTVLYGPLANTATFTATQNFKLNATGVDSLKTAIARHEPFGIMFISLEDINASEPSNSERIYFDQSPTMTVYYTPLFGGVGSLTALDSNHVILTVDTTYAGADTAIVQVWEGTDTVTVDTVLLTVGVVDTFTFAYADSLCRVTVYCPDAINNTRGTVPDSLYTQAAATHTLGGGWTQSSVFAKPLQGNNRLGTRMAIRVGVPNLTGPRWITTAGDTASLSDTSWANVGTWLAADSIFSTPCFATLCTLRTIHKNRDSLVTALSVATIDSLFGTVSVSAGFLDSTRVTGTTTISAKPSWVTTLRAWLSASSSTPDSAVSDTSAFTPGTAKLDTATGVSRTLTPNSLIALQANVLLNSHDSVAVSSEDTIWTDPLNDFTLTTVQAVNDTTLYIAYSIGGNPDSTRVSFIDSALAEAGSTKVWLTATGMSATPAKYTTSSFPDTLRWNVGTGPAPTATAKIRLYWWSSY